VAGHETNQKRRQNFGLRTREVASLEVRRKWVGPNIEYDFGEVVCRTVSWTGTSPEWRHYDDIFWRLPSLSVPQQQEIS
jgi:hypothetical protein